MLQVLGLIGTEKALYTDTSVVPVYSAVRVDAVGSLLHSSETGRTSIFFPP